MKNIRVRIFDKGKKVYDSPSVDDIRDYCREQIDTLWDVMLRFDNPQEYYVDLSQGLYDMKRELINEFTY